MGVLDKFRKNKEENLNKNLDIETLMKEMDPHKREIFNKHAKLAQKHVNELNYDLALNEYDILIELEPRDYSSYYNIGTILIEKKQYNDAIEKFNRAIMLNPKYYRAYRNLGRSFYFLGNYKDAKECFKIAIRLYPRDIAAHKYLGSIYVAEYEYDEAIEEFDAVINLNPNEEKIKSIIVEIKEKQKLGLI